jgi:hypothetical protein
MGDSVDQLTNTYSTFVSAKFYCEECDSYQYMYALPNATEIHCPEHYPEDDD